MHTFLLIFNFFYELKDDCRLYPVWIYRPVQLLWYWSRWTDSWMHRLSDFRRCLVLDGWSTKRVLSVAHLTGNSTVTFLTRTVTCSTLSWQQCMPSSSSCTSALHYLAQRKKDGKKIHQVWILGLIKTFCEILYWKRLACDVKSCLSSDWSSFCW